MARLMIPVYSMHAHIAVDPLIVIRHGADAIRVLTVQYLVAAGEYPRGEAV